LLQLVCMMKKNHLIIPLLLKYGCDKGNEHSCNALAFCYLRGKNIKQDVNKALSLYKYSCKTGLKNACYTLGLLYENGDGVRKDLKKAKHFYGLSCDMEFEDGCIGYAEMNQKGVK